MNITLIKPITIEEKEIKKIQLNLDDLTGKDILDADMQLRMRGVAGMNPIYSQDGLMIIASKVSGLLPDDLERLSAPDFLEVTANVSNFLMGWASPENESPKTSEKPS